MTLMTHIVAGYPTLRKSEHIARALIEGGSDFLEIQIPFSDPVADGPTILRANQTALKNNVTPDDCFALMKRLKQKTDIPMLFMTYYNIPFVYGLERFCKKAKAVRCYGLIIPDIPIDEEARENYLKTCKKYDLHAIQVISPLTPGRRLKAISKVASGFVYCVARFGTTGQNRGNLKLKKYIQKIKKAIKTPLAIGFGIRSKAEVEIAEKQADIVVIGSKVTELYKQSRRNKIKAVQTFIQYLKQ